MIGLPAGTRIWIAAGVTDMRCYAKLPIMRRAGEVMSGNRGRSRFSALVYFA